MIVFKSSKLKEFVFWQLKILVLIALLSNQKIVYSQVGINTTTPDPSAALDIFSTDKGVLIPKLTQNEKDAIANPAVGLLIFQIDNTSGFYYYTGTSWITFGGTGWNLQGQAGTDSTSNFIGTTDNQSFSIRTNDTEAIRATPAGNVGINEPNPSATLHITGNSPVLTYQDGNETANAVLLSDAFGNANWQLVTPPSGADDDWRFESGSDILSPIFHLSGGVVIGRTGTTIRNLDIDNGSVEGTTFGIGDIEFVRDGNNETQISHTIIPDFQGNVITLGSQNNVWNRIYAVNPVIQTSDKSLKKNIKSLPYGTKELMELRPVSYYWKEEIRNSLKIERSEKELKLGFIAQDVMQIIPEVVSDSAPSPRNGQENEGFEIEKGNYLSINYSELIPLLIKVKKEQHAKLLKLKEENLKLLNKIKGL